MIGRIDYNTYSRVAVMNSKLNSFLRDALTAKIEMTSSMSGLSLKPSSSVDYIGKNIDLYA